MSTRTLAIMFTDIKGFTARTSGESRAELNHLLDEHDKLLRPVFAHFHGTIVKTIGDAFLVWFESPTDAVVCGVTIQEVLRKHNAVAAERDRIDVRISINIGDVELRTDEASGQTDVFGEAVNLASRLEGITEAGEVWFTEAVYLTMNRHETPTAEVGERTFKGIPQPVRVYKVLWDPKSDQLAKIASAVEVVEGRPVLTGLPRPAGTSSTSAIAPASSPAAGYAAAPRRTAFLIGGIAALAVAGIAGKVALSRWQRATQLAYVQAALDHGDFASVVRAVDASTPVPPELALLGGRALEAQLDQKMREVPPKEALDWAQHQVEAHPWATSMQGRLPELEAEVAAWDVAEDGSREPELTKVLDRYPQDAVAPFVAARIVERSGMPQYVLKWYEMALERGHDPDPHVRELCEQTFHDFSPDAAWIETCERIEKKWYAKDRVLWAEKHLDDGNANEFLNAWAILHDEKRPEPDAPLHRDLHDFLSGVKDDAVETRLLAERDPAARERIHALVKTGIDGGTFGFARVDAMRAFLARLEKGT